jgi:hypothetical protein
MDNFTLTGRCGYYPYKQPRARGRNSWQVTKDETGFPGRAKMRQSPILPKVVGFPGFILSRPKNTCPFSARKGLTKSKSPMLTPPLDIKTSHYWLASEKAFFTDSGSSATLPKSITYGTPIPAKSDLNMILFESRT